MGIIRRAHNKYILFVPKNPSAAATACMYTVQVLGNRTHYIIIIMHILQYRGVIRSGLPKTVSTMLYPRRETLAGRDEFRFSKNRNRRRSSIIQNVSYRRFIFEMKFMRIYIVHDDTWELLCEYISIRSPSIWGTKLYIKIISRGDYIVHVQVRPFFARLYNILLSSPNLIFVLICIPSGINFICV